MTMRNEIRAPSIKVGITIQELSDVLGYKLVWQEGRKPR